MQEIVITAVMQSVTDKNAFVKLCVQGFFFFFLLLLHFCRSCKVLLHLIAFI